MDHTDPSCWSRLCTLLATAHTPWPSDECGVVACEPGWEWRSTPVDHDLWIVLSGRGSASVAGTTVALQAGSVVLMRPGDRAVARQHPTDRLTVAYCHFDFRPRPLPQRWLPGRHLQLSGRTDVARELCRVVDLVRDRHPTARLHSAAALLGVLLQVYREDAGVAGELPAADPRVRRVVERIRREPGHRLALPDAAASVGLSAVHFSRLFRRSVGTSYRAFVLETRLDRARVLLAGSTLPVARVARMLGYRDPALLGRQIRRRHGVAPSRLRRPPTPPRETT